MSRFSPAFSYARPRFGLGRENILRTLAAKHAVRPMVLARRWEHNGVGIVNYEEIRELLKDEKTWVVDVREIDEWAQGHIPTAKNIPLSKFANAWSCTEEEFDDLFGFKRPQPTDKMVVYCQAGVRSARAADLLRQHGYDSVRNYAGSWADYADRSKK